MQPGKPRSLGIICRMLMWHKQTEDVVTTEIFPPKIYCSNLSFAYEE